MSKLRIYVAGALNGMASDYVKNMHRMITWSKRVRDLGFSTYTPGLDLLEGLVLGNLEYEDYFQNSQPWLDAADAVFLVPGWEESKGTKREIERAKEKGIPVYMDIWTLKHVKEWADRTTN